MDLLFVVNDAGIIQSHVATPAVVKRHGLPVSLTGRLLADFLPLSQANTLLEHLAEPEPAGMLSVSLAVLQSAGRWRSYEATVTRLPISSGPGLWVIACQDRKWQQQTERLLLDSDARFRTLVEQMPALVYLSPIDGPGATMYVSPYISTILGYTADEWQDQSNLWRERLHPDDRECVEAESARTRRTEAPFNMEYRLLARDGHIVWVQDQAIIVHDSLRRPQFWQGVLFDISQRKRAEHLLAGQKQVLELIAEGVPLPKVLDTVAQVLEANDEGMLCSILLPNAEGTRLHVAAAPSLPSSYVRATDGLPIGPNQGCCGTAAYRRESVVTTDIETDPLWSNYRDIAREAGLRSCWSTPILSSDQRLLGTFALYYRFPCALSDDVEHLISTAVQLCRIAIERQQAADRLAYQAFFDRLTKLPNRALFEDRLNQALARAKRRSETIAVLFLDLDGFKAVNDHLGHAAGDVLLAEVAERLQTCVRQGDTVARFGGDEFVLLFEEGGDNGAQRIADRIMREFGPPFTLDSDDVVITPSIGIAFVAPHTISPDDPVRAADQAMYAAKRSGGNRFVVSPQDAVSMTQAMPC